MTSAAKVRANRANARSSTGPNSPAGRARSAQNALRHALSRPVLSDPSLSDDIEQLASEIAGPDANPEMKEIARRVADAQIDLRRIRNARHQFLSNKLSEPYYKSPADTRQKVAVIGRLLVPNAPDILLDVVEKFLCLTPEGPQKFALVLVEETKQLLAMDRYERRALSRRKFAIRAFDAARSLAKRSQNH